MKKGEIVHDDKCVEDGLLATFGIIPQKDLRHKSKQLQNVYKKDSIDKEIERSITKQVEKYDTYTELSSFKNKDLKDWLKDKNNYTQKMNV